MTDNDIIKALECCLDAETDCGWCPITDCNGDKNTLVRESLALINRQKEEIAVLKHELPDRKYGCRVSVKNGLIYTHTLDDYDWLIGDISAEAIKEFAEMLKEKASRGFWDENYSVNINDLDDLVKEMVGDAE